MRGISLLVIKRYSINKRIKRSLVDFDDDEKVNKDKIKESAQGADSFIFQRHIISISLLQFHLQLKRADNRCCLADPFFLAISL